MSGLAKDRRTGERRVAVRKWWRRGFLFGRRASDVFPSVAPSDLDRRTARGWA